MQRLVTLTEIATISSFQQNLGEADYPTCDHSYPPWNHPRRRRYWYSVVCSRQ